MNNIIFVGYQDGFRDMPAFPLFNIMIVDHPRYGSTVSLETLAQLGLEIKDYPSYTDYQTMKNNGGK